MKMLGSYVNGNHKVIIFNDGTKISSTINPNDDFFTSDFPESIDLKITNKCDMGCKFCHENSTPNGLHGDIDMKFIDSLKPYTEVAIGGGNPLAHPKLLDLLIKLKEKNIIANMTINQKHFMDYYNLIERILDKGLINGLGVSWNGDFSKLFIERISKHENIILHIINGLVSYKYLRILYDLNIKLLILGYKDFRRGHELLKNSSEKYEIELNQLYFKSNLDEIIKHFKVVSFDNLALKQLNVKNILSSDEWNRFYQGDDGSNTMYIDLVNQTFAKNSISTITYPLMDKIDDMFNVIKEAI